MRHSNVLGIVSRVVCGIGLLLIAGAEMLVRAAVRLAASLKVRPLIIGLSIVAFGSSAPQIAVSLQATLAGNTDIAVGSVIGSSIFNILVTLGLSALIIPLRVSRQLVRLDIPVMIGASMLFMKAKRPMMKPNGMPTSAATPKPTATRLRDDRMFQPIPWSLGPLL